MGALFELLAQLMVALVTAALAQIGAVEGSAREEAPSVQRTVLRSGATALPHTTASTDCPEQARLQDA